MYLPERDSDWTLLRAIETHLTVEEPVVRKKTGIVDEGLRHQSRVVGCENVEKITSPSWFVDEDIKTERLEETL